MTLPSNLQQDRTQSAALPGTPPGTPISMTPPPQPQSSAGAQTAPAINLPDLRFRLDDDFELLVEILEIYREEFPRLHQRLRDAILAEDLVLVEKAAHTLKGMLANISAEPAAAATSEVELLAQVPGASVHSDAFHRALACFESRVPELQAAVDACLAEAKL